MRVVLIACSYPPEPVVGSFRAAKLARAFRDAGHDVDVITTRLPGEEGPLRADEPGLRVHVVREVPGPAAGYRRLKQLVSGRWSRARGREVAAEAHGASDTQVATPRRIPAWKRYIFSALWVPDNRQGFVPAALARARPLLETGVDLVYTTAPPFSTHLAGLLLKLRSGVRWVAEYRDPWIENRSRMHLRSKGADAVNRWLERMCVRHADQLVAVSEGTRDLLISKLPRSRAGDVLLALNGIDNLSVHGAEPRPESHPFTISHLGSCYGGRDPRPFLHALATVTRSQRLTRADVRVEFIGNCRNYMGESLEELAAELGLADIVEFHDWMPQEEARSRAGAADLFLLPFPNHQRLIPNKLFDYLGMRRPILALVHPEGETARLLRQLGGHYLVGENSAATIVPALQDAIANCGVGPQSGEQDEILQGLTTERQMQKLMDELVLVPRIPA